MAAAGGRTTLFVTSVVLVCSLLGAAGFVYHAVTAKRAAKGTKPLRKIGCFAHLSNATLPHPLKDDAPEANCFAQLHDALASCTHRPLCGGVVRSSKGCDDPTKAYALRKNSTVTRNFPRSDGKKHESIHAWIRSRGPCTKAAKGRRGAPLKLAIQTNHKLKSKPIPKEDA